MAHSVICEVSCARPGDGLNDPHGSIPTLSILWFYEQSLTEVLRVEPWRNVLIKAVIFYWCQCSVKNMN